MKKIRTNVRVALLSNDSKLIESLVRKQLESHDDFEPWIDFEFISDREKVGDLAKYEIIVYDLDFVGGDLQHATIDLLEYKTNNPSTPLMLIGSRESVAEAMASERITPLIARSLGKPVLSSQLLIAIGVISPKLDESIVAQSTTTNRSRFLISGAIFGAMAIVVAVLLFPKSGDRSTEVVSSQQVTQVQTSNSIISAADPRSTPEHEVERIYQMAQGAINEGKMISPKGNNALFFLNQVLEIDPYHDDAYQSKQRLLDDIRVSFPQSMSLGELEQGERIVAALTQYDPFNKQNSELQLELKRAIEQQEYRQRQLELASEADQVRDVIESEEVISGTEETVAIVPKKSQSLDVSIEKLAKQKAQIEKQKLDQIYASINTGNLIPPSRNNAYTQLLDALRAKTVNETSLNSAKEVLATELIKLAKQSVANSELNNAGRAITFIRNLDSSHAELPELREQMLSKRNSIRAEKERLAKQATSQTPSDNTAALSVTPFKVLTRVEPAYPKRAYNLDIEGWVEVEYQVSEEGKAVNVKVTQADPKRMFDKSAIRAIKAWTFSPAIDSATGQAVMSEPSSSRFNFSLGS